MGVRSAREVRVARPIEGLPTAGDFEVVEVPVPEPGEGEVLVRNRFFQVMPALRTLLGGGFPGAPLPSPKGGDVPPGATIGEVVSARGGTGRLVSHFLGWREYAVVPEAQLTALGGEFADPAVHLGQGWTAWSALRAAEVREGDTVFVSGGAGSIGSWTGQVARLLGAGRVVGSTGSPEKAERMRAELGYDAVVVRGRGPIAGRLAEAAPDGVDVVIDNVGGEQLQAAVKSARQGARIVVVGALSGQMEPGGSGTTSPVELDSFEIIAKALVLRGLTMSPGHGTPEWKEWAGRFDGWLRSGELTFPHTRVTGIENAPDAFQGLLEGRYFGTVLVEL